MKSFLKTIFFLSILLFPVIVSAEDVLFFEFSPDYALPQKLPANQILSQEFLATNESINAVDLWVDNTGGAGNLSITLVDDRNVALVARSATVPTLNPIYTGNKIHVSLGSSINLISGRHYKIKIQSSLSKLRIYGLNKVQMVGHNEPYPISSIVGDATLDNTLQNYVIKFALFENADARGPVISNVVISDRDLATKRITFNIDELADYKFIYAPSGTQNFSVMDYKGYYSTCMAGVYNCFLEFPVSAGGNYSYKLYAKDRFLNETFYESIFQHIAPETPNQPNNPSNPINPTNPSSPNNPVPGLAISDVRIVPAVHGVNIYWKTNLAGNSRLTASSDSLGTNVVGTVFDNTFELEHNLAINSGLASSTPYFAHIISVNTQGQSVGQSLSFQTLSTSTPQTPAFPAINTSPAQAQVINNEISWSGSGGGSSFVSYKVDVFDKDKNLIQTIEVAKDSMNATLDGLKGGEYEAIVYGKNVNETYEKVAAPVHVVIKKGVWSYLIKSPVFYIALLALVIIVGAIIAFFRQSRKLKLPNV